MLNKCYRQSRDKGKIRHNTQNKDKPNKKLKRSDSSTDPTKNVGVNPGACDGKAVVVSYKTFIRLLILSVKSIVVNRGKKPWLRWKTTLLSKVLFLSLSSTWSLFHVHLHSNSCVLNIVLMVLSHIFILFQISCFFYYLICVIYFKIILKWTFLLQKNWYWKVYTINATFAHHTWLCTYNFMKHIVRNRFTHFFPFSVNQGLSW